MKVTAVILAAGQGTRMKSDLPKVLHPLCGKPMLWHVLESLKQAITEKPVVIVGYGAEQVKAFVGESAQCVLQEPQLGTAHAALQAESLVKGKADYVIVTYADMPLLRGETFQRLLDTQRLNPGPFSLLTVIADDPRGFGRIVRNTDGTVSAIVEEYVATPEQQKIKELNVGAYCFKADWLWDALHRIQKNPQKGEYYLTDVVELAVKENLPVQAVLHDDLIETIGINTRVHLAEAEAALRRRINESHMLNGVTMTDPASTYIEADIQIGKDTTILPNTYIQGETVIGERNVIGPNSHIRDTKIGNDCKIFMSVMEGAVLEDGVDMGPFARLRKGAHLGKHVHMGNFGEVKDSYLAEGVKIGHFSYIGNAQIGANTNIGAGTITCNFDGEKKHPTEIGEDVFIGSDTMLVAPLKIGSRARTGAGAVVTKNVAEDTLVVGMPARAIKKFERKKSAKSA
ncbi:MAG: bifunctional UDP-N-acetylglucosamine diphosphorylase/glucosamine-1-phosphate N-acetyltransferase GlmU [Chloroflexi bacterium]|nr:bifunctional UDP-N-acetylglucosamine diphosphorylase/glucosamine-1-phosphate N-acetyltransferase GlmU [Chloroflexota bacterium]